MVMSQVPSTLADEAREKGESSLNSAMACYVLGCEKCFDRVLPLSMSMVKCRAAFHFAFADSHQLSISSRLRPLVSGTARLTNRNAAIQIAAYSKNAPGAVNICTSERNVRVTSSVPDQRKTVAMDITRPRTRVGHISDINTHVPVPMPTAKQAT
jgi:hypothetical protein